MLHMHFYIFAPSPIKMFSSPPPNFDAGTYTVPVILGGTSPYALTCEYPPHPPDLDLYDLWKWNHFKSVAHTVHSENQVLSLPWHDISAIGQIWAKCLNFLEVKMWILKPVSPFNGTPLFSTRKFLEIFMPEKKNKKEKKKSAS